MADHDPSAQPSGLNASQIAYQNRPKVQSTSGHEVPLLHKREKDFYESARDKYLADYQFTHANDSRTLDRLLLLETQAQRYQWYLAAGMDYDLIDVTAKEETEYRRALKEILIQIQEIQKGLGVTKAERDAAASGDSVASYLENLRKRAKAYGIKREKESFKAILLINELFSTVGAYDRSNDAERKKLGFESAEDIVRWVLDYMKPEYDAIDHAFRKDGFPDEGIEPQRLWVGTL